jgi:hydrogenase maturation protein HypF
VFRLARELGLAGWVNNSAQGVFVELEGPRPKLESFLNRLEFDKPPRSFIQSLESFWLDAKGYLGFSIRESEAGGATTALVMADIATCPECRAEIFDPQNRRYLYPFTNCTNCGPRFSIIDALPYDRANTSMKQFVMCGQCRAEYDDPADRRFHAQPNACPKCGPHLEFWDAEGNLVAKADGDNSSRPLVEAARAISAGRIVAVKGLGGFHLMCAAGNDAAVQRLRQRKHRDEKPFALMCRSIEVVRAICEVSASEERLLRSPEAPIVLLRRSPRTTIAPTIRTIGDAVSSSVAPGNPNLGVMLPCTPLHHLLLSSIEGPVIATSGNLSDEPICIDEREALERLKGVADLFLVHNRPIRRHVDDSIARVMAGRELVLRRARGYAPLPIQMRNAERGVGTDPEAPSYSALPPDSALRTPHSALPTVLAVGAHLKNAVALAVGPHAFISQHIGDLETPQAYEAFKRVIADLQGLFASPAAQIAADLHPDYLSSEFARKAGRPLRAVQHHVAHVLACMGENQIEPPALGVSWDGTGYGLDGTIWGGEFFRINDSGFERVAHLRQFRLPGAEQAVREPRRSALGLLFEALGPTVFERPHLAPLASFSSGEFATLKAMLERKINSPLTSSVGRLFDAVASLAGLCQTARFEGQAAMQLEFALDTAADAGAYELVLEESPAGAVLDWRPGLGALLEDLARKTEVSRVSARFHNMLVEAVVRAALRIGLEKVVLSGGCFQNRYLAETTINRLVQAGFRVYWHQRVPPNDGGICLGQVVAARWWNV